MDQLRHISKLNAQRAHFHKGPHGSRNLEEWASDVDEWWRHTASSMEHWKVLVENMPQRQDVEAINARLSVVEDKSLHASIDLGGLVPDLTPCTLSSLEDATGWTHWVWVQEWRTQVNAKLEELSLATQCVTEEGNGTDKATGTSQATGSTSGADNVYAESKDMASLSKRYEEKMYSLQCTMDSKLNDTQGSLKGHLSEVLQGHEELWRHSLDALRAEWCAHNAQKQREYTQMRGEWETSLESRVLSILDANRDGSGMHTRQAQVEKRVQAVSHAQALLDNRIASCEKYQSRHTATAEQLAQHGTIPTLELRITALESGGMTPDLELEIRTMAGKTAESAVAELEARLCSGDSHRGIVDRMHTEIGSLRVQVREIMCGAEAAMRAPILGMEKRWAQRQDEIMKKHSETMSGLEDRLGQHGTEIAELQDHKKLLTQDFGQVQSHYGT